MKKTMLVLALAAGVFQATTLLALPSGISGRTLKSTTAGCGGSGCHGSGAATGITVTIAGPDTLQVGQVDTFTVSVTGSSGANGGVDIATRNGTLTLISSVLKSLNGELVHKQRVSVPATYQFTYTAPGSPGTDTLYATGKDNRFTGWTWAANHPITVTTATSVGDPAGLPDAFALQQNYPNPFNPTTRITYTLPFSERVSLSVYDISGRTVAILVDGVQAAGRHFVDFDGRGLAGGVYFYRLTGSSFSATRKLVLLK